MIADVHPGSGLFPIPDLGVRGKKMHRIQDPQHWLKHSCCVSGREAVPAVWPAERGGGSLLHAQDPGDQADLRGAAQLHTGGSRGSAQVDTLHLPDSQPVSQLALYITTRLFLLTYTFDFLYVYFLNINIPYSLWVCNADLWIRFRIDMHWFGCPGSNSVLGMRIWMHYIY